MITVSFDITEAIIVLLVVTITWELTSKLSSHGFKTLEKKLRGSKN